MASEEDSTGSAEEKMNKKTPSKGPPSRPPKGAPMGMPMGMFPGMIPPSSTPPQRTQKPPVKQEEPINDEDDSIEDVDEVNDDVVEKNTSSEPMDEMIGKAIAQTPMSEVDALRHENESLRNAVTGAAGIINDMDNPPMPPVVGDGFVIPAHVVGDFVRVGRQLQREGLCHATSGSISTLSLDQPNLVHMTAAGSSLGQLDERYIVSGRLGDSPPYGAGDAWRIHTILLAVASLEHKGRAACVYAPAPYSTTMSLEQDLFVLRPSDAEGKKRFESVVIVDSDDVSEEDFLRQLSEGLQQSKCKAIVVRGAGVYAVGADFNEAWDNAATIENSMKISYLMRLADIEN